MFLWGGGENYAYLTSFIMNRASCILNQLLTAVNAESAEFFKHHIHVPINQDAEQKKPHKWGSSSVRFIGLVSSA